MKKLNKFDIALRILDRLETVFLCALGLAIGYLVGSGISNRNLMVNEPSLFKFLVILALVSFCLLAVGLIVQALIKYWGNPTEEEE